MPTRVVHIRKEKCEVYIGRKDFGMHFGNPFTHLVNTKVKTVKMGSREEAITAFDEWLSGKGHQDVEPERRQWILDNIGTLKGKVIGCFCSPQTCHGDVLKRYADEQ